MPKKSIKKKNLKDLKSSLGINLTKKKIEIFPTNLLKNSKNKITNFFEDYKKNKEKEKIKQEKQRKINEKKQLLKEKKDAQKEKLNKIKEEKRQIQIQRKLDVENWSTRWPKSCFAVRSTHIHFPMLTYTSCCY